MAKLSTGVISDNGVDIVELDKNNTSRSIIKGLHNQARKSLIIRSGDNQAFHHVSPNFSNSADHPPLPFFLTGNRRKKIIFFTKRLVRLETSNINGERAVAENVASPDFSGLMFRLFQKTFEHED
jgi:hypothetical protein